MSKRSGTSRSRTGADNDPFAVSWRIQEDASRRGFDWPHIDGVFAKVREEIGEVEEAERAGCRQEAQRELGDLLFAVVNLARFIEADVYDAMAEANARFSERFALLEAELVRQDRRMEACNLEELDAVWEEVKARLRRKDAVLPPKP